MVLTIRNCRIRISFSFAALVALILLIDRSETTLWVLAAAAAHEAGHLAAMILLKSVPQEINFSPFGIEIVQTHGRNRSYTKDILVSAAGPSVNLLCFTACLLMTGGQEITQNIPLLANLTIGCFNGLPIIPLDGGHILYAILCMRIQEDKAAKIVRAVSFLTLLPLAVAGFYILLTSKYNFALLLLSCYLIAMLLLKKGKYD